jgi:hypothetical protein
MEHSRCHTATLILLVLSSLITGCGLPPQPIQDQLDQQALRRQFNLPAGYDPVSYDGYPSMVGFGQREGLEISIVYRLDEKQLEDFLLDAPIEGWKPLPIPQAVRRKILYQGMNVPLDLQSGLYVCRTAGDNVLHARQTRSCSDVDTLHDIILGVFDPAEDKLYLVIRSGY